MGFPRITFGSRTIDLDRLEYHEQTDPGQVILQNRAAAGLVQTLNVRAAFQMSAGFRWFENSDATATTLKRQFNQWFQYAAQDRPWFYASDSSEQVLTTLSAPASAGYYSLSVTSLTGISTGKRYIVRNFSQLDLVKVLGLNQPSAGQVLLSEPLVNNYESGSRFRSELYFPARLLDYRNPVQEVEPMHYNVELLMEEDVNDL
jgi:hypothetical protein